MDVRILSIGRKNEPMAIDSFKGMEKFVYENEHFTCVAERNGQRYPTVSNDVKVTVTVTSKTNENRLIEFKLEVFEHLPQYWNNWVNTTHNAHFYAKTWKEAFFNAHQYIASEIDAYEKLVEERKQALLEAEE